MPPKVLVIFGTRPEAIKMVPLVHQLIKHGIPTEVCITAQHRGMLDSVMQFFDLTATYDLDLMLPNQSLNKLASRIFETLDTVLQQAQPDLVLVHGDTTTSVVAAWAAFHWGIKVGHVEAGLRTYNKQAPFPEELNRQITSKIADYHFAPTLLAKQQLLIDGIAEQDILLTGNTVIDALQLGLQKLNTGYVSTDLSMVKKLVDVTKKLILVTGHRRENFGEGFESVCAALKKIAEREDIQIIYPVHMNPNVQRPVQELLGTEPNIKLISPIDYPAFIYLMSKSYLILTDSGGVQEEAPSLGKPVLVFREITERPEAVEAGTAKIVGTSAERILSEVYALLDDMQLYAKMKQAENSYGDGQATQRIVDFIIMTFSK
ncbi:MAG: UDP-N-acetylglucosamine 2-epimerase (non-hydrolyzing) [Bacteroidota bacterium]